MSLTIEQLYLLPTLKLIEEPLNFLLYNDFLTEVGNQKAFNNESKKSLKQGGVAKKFTVRIVKANTSQPDTHFPIDEWKLASVWYTMQPIMILRNDNYYRTDGYPRHFITNQYLHKIMLWEVVNNLKEDIIINNSIYEFNERQLFGDFINQEPQLLDQPQVYDLDLATLAINL
jgi:hypothetical protein